MNRIKDVLEIKQISQGKLSRALDVSPNTINNYCNNKTQPTLEMMFRIAEYLKIDVKELIEKKEAV